MYKTLTDSHDTVGGDGDNFFKLTGYSFNFLPMLVLWVVKPFGLLRRYQRSLWLPW
jgi:hypothetical protein